ncbi:MAG: HAD-IA family hydrolase [Tetrasphaera sp.]|nr:HAD-IA family hydrolase [Tetrasphaera sp.]
MRRWHGVPALGVIAHFLPRTAPGAARQRLTDLRLADAHDIPLLPGAAEALAALAGSRPASLDRDVVHRRSRPRPVAASGLVIPPVFVTADAVARGNPLRSVCRAARRLGVSPADCLVVEDAPAGLASGRAAGCTTLAVTTTSTRAAPSRPAAATPTPSSPPGRRRSESWSRPGSASGAAGHQA